MNSKVFRWAVRIITVLVLAVPAGAPAQAPIPGHLSGIINDYTPATGVGGPWEMHGAWWLKIKGESGKADFSAVMTMEHPDYWIVLNPANVDNPGARSPHTHHITMTDAVVSYDTSVCPVDNPPTTGRLVVTGQASITGNGSPAPFEIKGPSTLQVCITGGTEVQSSNVTLVLTGPATGHFGTQAIHGVVRIPRKSDEGDGDRH
ncbi:MAG: hypothetical protein WCE53_08220 [Candidatus Acidiferrum sp.]